MLMLISPAKTMNFKEFDVPETSLPLFQGQAFKLVKTMRQYSVPQLMECMDISEKLAALNTSRFKQFRRAAASHGAGPAIMAYRGDVYLGLDADSLNRDDLLFAQKHLRILSGLYGMLKPLDLIQPYRLEMGIPVAINGAKNLYEFWTDRLTKLLKKELKHIDDPFVVNLASQEYSRAIDFSRLKVPVYEIVFRERRNNTWQFVSYNAKRARGAFSRFIIRNRIDRAEDIKLFSEDGYRFHPEMSDSGSLFFVRD